MRYKSFKLLVLCCYANQVYAHPHEWMNIIVEPEFNEHNEIIALQQTWLFDPLYAQILLEPVLLAQDNDSQRKGMEKIEQEIISKLAKNQYYTVGETSFLPATDQSLYVNDGYLYFRFTLPLNHPQNVINFSIYEPTYYVEMRYDEQNQQTKWSNGCTLSITESSPSMAMVQAAYTIDIDETGPSNLGQYFAQNSQLQCPTK